MSVKYVFADEAGNFDFSRGRDASRYFILPTVVADSGGVGEELLRLRRDLVWRGIEVGDGFHATEDRQEVRDAVFRLLVQRSLRVDATIFEKAKARPHLIVDEPTFYKYAWFYHFKHVAAQALGDQDRVMIVSASLGTRRKRAAFRAAIEDVARQLLHRREWRVGWWSAASDPCLQVADYCCWAIQRRWERGDDRSYRLVQPLIASEYEIWRDSRTLHY